MIGELSPLRGARNPGDFNERAYWGMRGAHWKIVRAKSVEVLGVNGLRGHFHSTVASVRKWVEMNAIAPLDLETAAVGRALMLGDRSAWSDSQREQFAKSGIMHLFAISGLHVGMMALILSSLLALLPVPKLGSRLLTVALIWLYVPLTGGQPPVVRASVILTFVMIGSLLQRQNRAGYALTLAWIGLLAWRPQGLGDAGFQLTFAGTAGVLIAAEHFRDLNRPLNRRDLSFPARMGDMIWRNSRYLFLISLAATVATAPVLIAHFGRLPWMGPVVTLFAAPLLPLVLIAGWGTVIFGSLPLLGGIFGDAFWALLHALIFISESAANRLPVGEHLSWTAALFAALSAILLFSTLGELRSRPIRGALFAVLLVAASAAWARAWVPDSDVKFAVLDVGQGDGILIRQSDRAVVIDGGRKSIGVMKRQLRLTGVRSIELLMLTHGDTDHAGAAAEFVRQWPVKLAVVGPGVMNDEAGAAALKALQDRGVPVYISKRGTVISTGTIGEFTFLWPDSGVNVAPHTDDNDLSLVIHWNYGEYDALFPGDVGRGVERKILAGDDAPDVELLVAGHHGSRYSTSTKWLDALSPEYVAISAGRNNPYGHPAKELLTRLCDFGVSVHRTDHLGALMISLSESGFRFLSPAQWW
jgi:competence protein ComEC